MQGQAPPSSSLSPGGRGAGAPVPASRRRQGTRRTQGFRGVPGAQRPPSRRACPVPLPPSRPFDERTRAQFGGLLMCLLAALGPSLFCSRSGRHETRRGATEFTVSFLEVPTGPPAPRPRPPPPLCVIHNAQSFRSRLQVNTKKCVPTTFPEAAEVLLKSQPVFLNMILFF